MNEIFDAAVRDVIDAIKRGEDTHNGPKILVERAADNELTITLVKDDGLLIKMELSWMSFTATQ